jgi:hypothetical protein
MEKVPVSQLITLLEQELIRQGYKDTTLKYYRDIWKRIAAHFESCGEIYFSESVAMEYVDGKCDFFKKESKVIDIRPKIFCVFWRLARYWRRR